MEIDDLANGATGADTRSGDVIRSSVTFMVTSHRLRRRDAEHEWVWTPC
jgi:hypothetical protein